jgi:hypothetical protein
VNKKIFKVFIIVICVMKTSCDATVKTNFLRKQNNTLMVLTDLFYASTKWCDLWNSIWRILCVREKQTRVRATKTSFFLFQSASEEATPYLQRSSVFLLSLPHSLLPTFSLLIRDRIFVLSGVGMEKPNLTLSEVGVYCNRGVSQQLYWL